MSETLILVLGHSPGAPVHWAFLGGAGLVEAGVCPSAEALRQIAGRAAAARRVAALLPGEQVAMRMIAAPPKNAGKFSAAAAYLLEDELAESLEGLHIATALKDGAGLALAVKTSIMAAWHDAFAEAGLAPDFLSADFALLPSSADTAVVVIESLRIIGAIGGEGFAAERPFADGLLTSLLHNEAIERVAAFGDSEGERIDFAGKAVEWRGAADPASLFYLYRDGLGQNGAPNFLRGAYRKKRDWRGALKPWRRTGALAAACLAGLLFVMIADGVRASRLATAFDDKAQSLHASTFPEAVERDPRAHARQILAAQSPARTFLHLSADFAGGIEEASDIQIDRIRYNAARNEFSVNLRFNDINDLERLKQSLAARGVEATEAGGVQRSGAQYVGELRIDLS